MADEYVLSLNHPHPEDLASARTVAPGERVPADAVDPKNPHDWRLIEEGALIKVPADNTEEDG